MSRKTRRAAIIAAAAMMLFGFTTADGFDAVAQETGKIDEAVQAPVDSAAEVAAQGPEVRFVAHEVVQEVAEEAEPAALEIPSAASLSELVGDLEEDGQLSADMRCLAQAIYFESRGEPLDGQLAVGRVIVNRAESPRFPDSYCAVVKQRSQFSFVKGGRIPEVRKGSLAWQRAKAVARIAHQELWDSPAGDALFFHAKYVKPSWARRKVARATIDSHIFYR